MKKKFVILKKENLENINYFKKKKKFYIKTKKGEGVYEFKETIQLFFQEKFKFVFFFSKKYVVKNYLSNMSTFLEGIYIGFFFRLTLRGIGYKCYFFGHTKLFISLGYSHFIIYNISNNVIIFLRKNRIFIYSLSNDILGNVVKDLKNLRIQDIYKAKGIVDYGKVFNLKEGKKR